MGGGTFIPAEVVESGSLFGMEPLVEDIESRHIIGGPERMLPPDVLELLEGDYDENDLQDDFIVVADASCSDDDDYYNDMPPPLEYYYLGLFVIIFYSYSFLLF